MKQTYTIRLDTELHAKIKEEALVKWKSLSQYIEDMITWAPDKPHCPRPPCVKQPTQSPKQIDEEFVPTTREEIIDHVVDQLPTVVPKQAAATPTIEQNKEDAAPVSQYY